MAAGLLNQLRSIALLPGTVLGVIPGVIVWRSGCLHVTPLGAAGGCLLILAGLALMAWTITLFARRGRGTLAPWDATQKLVVAGPYRHVRNPMITGVLCVLLGEAVLTGCVPILIWFGIFAAVNAFYTPLVEEPGLVERFGDEYVRYRKNVPRWIPRPTPWDPAGSD